MPTSLKKSLVRGAQYEVTPDTRRLVVPHLLKTVDIAGAQDVEVLVNCEVALFSEHGIEIGDALSATYPQLKLMRIRIQPVLEKNGKDVWVECEYLWEPEEFAPTMYTIRDSTVAIQRETYYIPGTNKTISAAFAAASGGPVQGGGSIEAVTQDLIKARILMPSRAMSIAALRYGRPAGGWADKVGYVNNATWPVGTFIPASTGGSGGYSRLGTPLPPSPQPAATENGIGFWLLNEFSSEWYQSGQTLIRATAVTQVVEDWSYIFYLENRTTGKRPFGGYTEDQQTAFMTALRSPSYSRGVIAAVNGALRVGFYPTTNFQSLFGF